MLVKGDKIVAKKNVHGVIDKGEICEVITDNNGIISFSFGGGLHKGLMSIAEFEENFEKYEEPKAPTVLEENIDEIIADSKIVTTTTFDKCTIVSCQLPNGFVITESSACVDPKNYDLELGKEICMKKIKDKIWELEAYLLQTTLYIDNLCDKLCSDCDCECGDCECDCLEDDKDYYCENECGECDEHLNSYCDGCKLDEKDEDEYERDIRTYLGRWLTS